MAIETVNDMGRKQRRFAVLSIAKKCITSEYNQLKGSGVVLRTRRRPGIGILRYALASAERAGVPACS